VDFAWNELVSNAPMMANPAEYHTMMYELFWNGNAPQQRTTADGKPGSAKTVPKKALDDMNALFEEAKKLRGELPDE